MRRMFHRRMCIYTLHAYGRALQATFLHNHVSSNNTTLYTDSCKHYPATQHTTFLSLLQANRRRLRPVSAIPGEPDKDLGLAPESGTGGSGLGRSQGTARPLSASDDAGRSLCMCFCMCFRCCAGLCIVVWAAPRALHGPSAQAMMQVRAGL